MSLLLALIGVILLLPAATLLAFFAAATVDFLVAGGRSATTVNSNEDLQLGMHRIRDPGAVQPWDRLRFL